MFRRRTSLLVALAMAVLVPAGAVAWFVSRADPVPAVTEPSRRGQDVVPALRVLRSWDSARAAAYAGGDVTGLRDLYVPGSAAGAADVRLLRHYRSRSFRVVGMRTQVLAFGLLETGRERMRVRVTDRLTGAVAVRPGVRVVLPPAAGTVRPGERVVLPRDRASVRVLTLVRGDDGRWRVSDVADDRGSVSRGRRPAAMQGWGGRT